MMTPGTSTMLRARRRDVNVKPNRRLDRKSSRGMLYENEELRLRTININAEVERGQNDIKKLRRENEQLRREIWGLREEYDRLEGLLGKEKRRGQLGNSSQDEDSDNEEQCEDEDEEYDEEEDDDDEASSQCEHSADLDNAENQQKASSSSVKTPGQSRRNSLKVEFDGLSIVDEETETVSNNDAEQCAEDGPSALSATHQPHASRHARFEIHGIKTQDSENCALISNRNQVGGACLNAVNGMHRQEQQFFGKIKLPNGKEGVFMSDVMLPNSNTSNGLQIYGSNNLTGNSYDFISSGGFRQNEYHMLNENAWPDIPAMLPGGAQNVIHNASAGFPSSQSHYNYTFTPVDSTPLPDSTSTRDNYAFERPNNLSGIPDGDTLLPNIAKCLETTDNPYLRGSENTALQECGVNDDTYFGMGENIEATTTVMTSDDVTSDYFHTRGGPDLFISGAYPVATSPGSCPVGGNLDQLLKQMCDKEKENIPTVKVKEVVGPATVVVKSESDGKNILKMSSTENVQEVIDALETQIDSKVNDAVQGVRVMNGNCYVCIAKEDNAGALLETGLTLRGAKINLEDVSRDTITVALSGVPHDVPDSNVARVVANYGTVIGEVERRLYKGVDTGERIVRLKPADVDIKNVPSTINLAGSKATLRILKPDEIQQLGTACVPESSISGVTGATEKDDTATKLSNAQTQSGENPTKSLDSSFSTDRYRSQLNVRLKQPKLKTNRSMESIFGSTDDKTQHNTSLPIIDTLDSTTTKSGPVKMSSETTLSETRNTKPQRERLFNFDNMESTLPQKLLHLLQTDTKNVLSASDNDTSNKEAVTGEGRQKSKEQEFDQTTQGNRVPKTDPLNQPQSSPETAVNHTPNIFSKLPDRVSKCQNSQILSTTDDSTDSADFQLTSIPQLQSNPFIVNFPTASPNKASSCCNRRPITPLQINPFLSSTPNPNNAVIYQDVFPHGEHSVQCHNPPHLPHLQSPSTLQPDLTFLTPSDHQSQFCVLQGTSNSRACSPYSHVTSTYSHSIQPSNIGFISNDNLYMPNSVPTSFPSLPFSLPATFLPLSSNRPSASIGPSRTSPTIKNNILQANSNYFPSPPSSSHVGLQVAPPITNVPGNTGYFLPNLTNITAPSTTYVPGNVAVVVPPSVSIPGSAESCPLTSDLPTNTHPANPCTAQPTSLAAPSSSSSSANMPNVPPFQLNSKSSEIVLGTHSEHPISAGTKPKQESNDVMENTLEDNRIQSVSVTSSPVSVRKQTAQRKASRKASMLSHQHSKSSGDEGPNHSPSTAHRHINTNRPPSPGDTKRKAPRKMSSTNSLGSHHNVDNSINESSAGTAGGPNATSSPNTNHKTSAVQRKFSTGVAGSTDAQGGGHTNVIDVSRSSSSGQDSPTKPDRRRRVSIYFNNKKGAAKRRDSTFLPNGGSVPSGGVLSRSLSLDHTHRYAGGSTTEVATSHCAGAEMTATTCSDRERTNSISSRTSSAAGGHGSGRLRKHSVCSARGGNGSDVGKVPWCGCWGNGCI